MQNEERGMHLLVHNRMTHFDRSKKNKFVGP
jgi:hypothetical protein